MGIQFDFRELARGVFVFFEEIEKLLDRLAVDFLRLEQGPRGIGQAVDSSVLVIAIWVTQVVLQVANQHLRPIHHVQRTVWCYCDAAGSEVRVFFDVSLEKRGLERFAFEAGAFLGNLCPEDSLKADDVGVEEESLPVVGEMATAENRGAGAWAGRAVPELAHAGMRSGIEVSAEGWAEVVRVAGCVRDDVVAPVVKNAAVRVGEAVGHVAVEATGARFEPIDCAVDVANRASERFNVGAVEHAIAEIDGATGFVADGVGFVMGIGGVESVNDALFPIGFSVTVGVADEPHVGRLHDEDSVLVELESGRAVESVEECGAFREVPRFWIDIEHEEFVEHLGGRGEFGVAGPCGDPEASFGVEGHLDGVDQFGELFLGGDVIDFNAFRSGEVFQ